MAQNQKLVAAVLLAAGAGKRFGGDKLVHPLEDGVAIAAHSARNLLAATPEVIAVVRWGDFPLYDMLEQEGCQVTMFQGAARGMGASLAHGVAQARGAEGWVIALADMPRIAPDTIRMVIAALEAGASIAAPVHKASAVTPSALGLSYATSCWRSTAIRARAVMERHREAVKLLECDDPGILLDIDRKDDLGNVQGRK